jgi:hypothetical protein
VVGMRILIHFILLCIFYFILFSYPNLYLYKASGCPYQISLQRFVDSEAQVLAFLQFMVRTNSHPDSWD